ncbi:uncharacterized protein [Anabrus simplex]|uniref:uncharacterized protein isoform X2 n=1 Tax=Anabrus simplex TaxID=316456 RepID=UPI0034DD0BDF
MWFCYLAFSSPEKAQKAMEELSSVSYKDLGLLHVRPKDDHLILPRSTGAPDDRKRWLIVYGIPPNEPDLDVLEAFRRFGCTFAHVHHQDINEVLKKGSARLVFNTVEDSEAFVANTDLHNYKGATLEVKFLNTGPSKSARRRLQKNVRRRLLEQMGYL